MKDNVKFIALASQKGGTGKTTFTTLFASYLRYVEKKKVLVIDCDSQQSLVGLSEREKFFLANNPILSEFITSEHDKNGTVYNIIRGEQSGAFLSEMTKRYENDYDYFIFDTAGTLFGTKQREEEQLDILPSVVTFFLNMDIILCPITHDYNTIESNLNFIEILRKHKVKTPDSNVLLTLFATDIGARGQNKYLQDQKLDRVAEKLRKIGVYFLSSKIPHFERFRREIKNSNGLIDNVVRTTHFFPKGKALSETNIKSLIQEVLYLLENGVEEWKVREDINN
jgi:cellulose biosynthesis protein BcsQ